MSALTSIDDLRRLYRNSSATEKKRIVAQLEEKVARRRIQTGSRYSTFKTKYRNDWAGFVTDCIAWREGQGPTAYQLAGMRKLGHGPGQKSRLCRRGPHGLGKTTWGAWYVLWFALTRDGDVEHDWKCVTTAGAWRQLTKYLWPEIHKWAGRLRWEVIGRGPFDPRTELQTLSLKLSTGEAFAVASNNHELIEGAHADSIAYLYDEGKAIPPKTWEASEGAFSGAVPGSGREALAAAFSTPGEPLGVFYDIQKHRPGYEDWDAAAVSLEDAIVAGRISREWAEQRRRQWGENSAIYQRRVLGNFASDDEDAVIPLSWIEAAQERWREWDEAGRPGVLKALGMDVGGGGDPSVLARSLEVGSLENVRRAVPELIYEETADTLKINDEADKFLRDDKALRCVVDAIGVGAGNVNDLRRRGYTRIVGFVANSSPPKDKKGDPVKDRSGEFGFADRRSWAWWTMREMLDPQYDEKWALPPDDRLSGDLSAPHWGESGKGNIRVESKDDVKKRLHRSTDAADAVIQMLDEGEPEREPSRIPHSTSGRSMLGRRVERRV